MRGFAAFDQSGRAALLSWPFLGSTLVSLSLSLALSEHGLLRSLRRLRFDQPFQTAVAAADKCCSCTKAL
uniref:Putative secreted protein n=1 Tax=Anopheles darlingi TaxID=43151 RepID=A0A2M4DI83_ANODA